METTTEKPVLDVEAPGVRVAVYAPARERDRWIAAYWRKVKAKFETKHKEAK